MKKFIIKTFLISVCFFISLSVIIFYLQYNIREKSTVKINSNTNSLILGHSHPECAFNDSIISGCINLSSAGESYFYTFLKLKKIKMDNPQIKKLYIEFGVNNISKEMDEWTWSQKHMTFRYPDYSPFMTFSDLQLLVFHNLRAFIASLPLSVKHQLNRTISNDYNYLKSFGGFAPQQGFITAKNSLNYSVSIKDLKDISINNIIHLKHIIKYCSDNKITVYLIRSPILNRKKESKSEKIFKTIRQKYFSNIPFLDFSDFSSEVSDFKDAGHLNKIGADKFSKWFSKSEDRKILTNGNEK